MVVSGNKSVNGCKIVANTVIPKGVSVFREIIRSIFAAVITEYLYLKCNYT